MNTSANLADGLDLNAHPGGDQNIVAALPEALAECLAKARRLIFIANNPCIGRDDVAALAIGVNDVVVSFNLCSKLDLLAGENANILVHGFNAPDHYFFGLPYQPEVAATLDRLKGSCFTMLVGCAAPMSALPDVMLLRDRIPLPVLWNYPTDRPGGKRYVGPSTGFNAMVVLDALRGLLGFDYQMLALGFSSGKTKLWGGHAWDYEREWLRNSNIVSVPLKSPAKSSKALSGWWAKLTRRGR